MGYSPMQAQWPKTFDAVFHTDVTFPSTSGAGVPREVLTAKRPAGRSRIAESLEEFRKILIGYELCSDSGSLQGEWKSYDPGRLKNYPAETDWPKDYLRTYRVDTNPDSFEVVGEKEGKSTIKLISGPRAFTVPLEWPTQTEGSATLLLLEGVTSQGSLTATGLTPLVCRGPMAGDMLFLSWTTALVRGDLSGDIESFSYLQLVVTVGLAPPCISRRPCPSSCQAPPC